MDGVVPEDIIHDQDMDVDVLDDVLSESQGKATALFPTLSEFYGSASAIPPTVVPNNGFEGVPVNVSSNPKAQVDGEGVEVVSKIASLKPTRQNYMMVYDPSIMRYVRSLHMKDDADIVEIKIWMQTADDDEFVDIKLDDLLQVCTNSVRSMNEEASQITPQVPTAPLRKRIATTPYVIHVSDRDPNCFIKRLTDTGQEYEISINAFRKPIRCGLTDRGQVSTNFYKLSELRAACIENMSQTLVEVKVLLAVKRIHSAQKIKTRKGETIKRTLTVFDDSMSEADLTLWADQANLTESMKEFSTVFVLSNPSYSMFRDRFQLSTGYATYFEIEPSFNDAEFLRHYVRTMQDPSSQILSQLNGIGAISGRVNYTVGEVDLRNITTLYTISDLKTCAREVTSGEVKYGLLYAIVSDFDIDKRSSLGLLCKGCKDAHGSSKEHVWAGITHCRLCGNELSSDRDTQRICKLISFIDDEAEWIHPDMQLEAICGLLGCEIMDMERMSLEQRSSVKSQILFQRCKLFFKMSWDNVAQKPLVTIIDAKLANLNEMAAAIKAAWWQ